MSEASEEDSGATSAAAAAATVTAATVAAVAAVAAAATPLDQPLNLCVAKKSRDSSNSPMPATKQSQILGKSATKKGKHWHYLSTEKKVYHMGGNYKYIQKYIIRRKTSVR